MRIPELSIFKPSFKNNEILNTEIDQEDEKKEKERLISIGLEDELREVQEKLKIAPEAEIAELKAEEKEALEKISQRAIIMDKEREKEETNIESRFDRGKESLGRAYDSAGSTQERINNLLALLENDRVKKAIRAGVLTDEDVAVIKSKIESDLNDVRTKEEFVQKGFAILEPFMRKTLDPENIRKIFVEGLTRVRPEGLINYGFISDNDHSLMNLHIAYGRDMSTGQIGVAVLKDLKALAEVVKQDEDIKIISGTSHVVAAAYKFFERNGFQIEAFPKERREKYFKEAKSPILRAWITREDFLKKFLK